MAKIPLTLITGFLGSGKTSFLGQYLGANNDKGIAVIINEIGQVALDQRVLRSSVDYSEEQMLYLNAGCVCCNRRVDLVESLRNVLNGYDSRGEVLNRVIIETTGLANPAPILWTLLSDTFLGAHFEAQGVIACIDALNGFLHLENNEAREQIIFADSILLTKTDLQSDEEALSALRAEILGLNPSVEIFDKAILGANYERLFTQNSANRSANQATNRANLALDSQDLCKYFSNDSHKPHAQGFDTLSISFSGAIEWSGFGIWLSLLLHKYGTKVLRVKGIIDIGEDFLVSINGAMHIIHPPTHIKKDAQAGSNLVFITRNLPKEKIIDSLKGFKCLLGMNEVLING
ncbi:CobW family GTP-binding protein [Helicobacter macacae]|uniref:CobW C-terminal domain-containing protein n=1 Tax=Helicobacter macacae MIT 99-5501 TaxID=1357400 RepID=V8C6M7_9HELI|nr:GTP-binding protein [Helicobacter macacae]ETD22999.1 hypothetical protein HMPREF2086_01446 [Helicobacter macacae MIT 99-5501]